LKWKDKVRSVGLTFLNRASGDTAGNFRIYLFRNLPDLSLRTSEGVFPFHPPSKVRFEEVPGVMPPLNP